MAEGKRDENTPEEVIEERDVEPDKDEVKPRKFNWIQEGLNILLFIIAFGLAFSWFKPTAVTMDIYNAGSLTVPLEEIKRGFEADYQDVTLQLEPAGSVTSIQKITELGKKADLLAVADYSLIPSMMMPNFTDWYILFARNEMTLTYTKNSMYADNITEDNWYQILSKPGVKWGFSDPNQDPCGYRTLMVIQLAETEYNQPELFENLVGDNSAITVSLVNRTFYIDAALEDLDPDTEHLVIREKSVDLIYLLESGGLDYAFEYSSVAVQHNLSYIDLPSTIDLSSIDNEEMYATVIVEKITGTSTGSPIVYGLTIPKNAENPTQTEKLVAYILGNDGQQIFADLGQPPVDPAIASDVDLVPESLRDLVVELE
jgi:molybdate/tungstate transport system substrate-binding protein